MKILVAEDDNISRLLLRKILSRESRWEVIEACDGSAAWSMIEKGQPLDLAILDIMMPGIDGLELLRRIRGSAQYKSLPVILCSAVNDRTTLSRAQGLFINHYVLKPYSRESMIGFVKAIESAKSNP